MGRTYSNCEDVIVQNTRELSVKGAHDVFVEAGATDDAVEISQAEDVRIEDAGTSHRSLYRDTVVRNGGEASVRRAEDVAVKPNSVSGTIQLGGVEDVLLEASAGASIQNVEDIFFESGGVRRDHVEARNVEDIYFRSGAVQGDVYVANPDTVKVADGGVSERVVENAGKPRRGTEVVLRNTWDVVVEEDAIRGSLLLSKADEVTDYEGGGFLSRLF